jgi:hypothetical protein
MENIFEMVKKNWVCFPFLSEEQQTAEICHAAVEQSGSLLQNVPEKLKSKELCQFAVEHDKYGRALRFVPKEFLTPEL